jgi:hypothetical protein
MLDNNPVYDALLKKFDIRNRKLSIFLVARVACETGGYRYKNHHLSMINRREVLAGSDVIEKRIYFSVPMIDRKEYFLKLSLCDGKYIIYYDLNGNRIGDAVCGGTLYSFMDTMEFYSVDDLQ